jgi:isopenicillin-N N-acyltransferase like protein
MFTPGWAILRINSHNPGTIFSWLFLTVPRGREYIPAVLERGKVMRSAGLRTTLAGGLALAVLLIIAPRPAIQAEDGRPIEPDDKLRIVDLAGTPYQMGQIHGRTLKTEIRDLVGRWKKDLEKTYGVAADVFARALLAKTDFKPAIDRWTPGLLDEVRGIADGAGIDFDTMYAYQLIDEVWTLGPDLGFPKCTTVASGKRNGNPAFVAQTLDIPSFYHGYQTVLRIRDEENGLEALVFTIPGVIAANGMNSRSIGVCVNAVTQLAYSPKGLPVDFVIRGLLRRKTYKEAVKFLEDIQPAAPQTYLVGGPEEAAVFERSAGKMSRFVPFAGAEFSYHTNHPLVNDDYNPKFPAMLKRNDLTLASYQARCPRFKFLGDLIKDNSAILGLDALKAIFTNRASGINNTETYGCTIMVLGEKPELHISPGRPDEAPFQVLGFAPRSGRAEAR